MYSWLSLENNSPFFQLNLQEFFPDGNDVIKTMLPNFPFLDLPSWAEYKPVSKRFLRFFSFKRIPGKWHMVFHYFLKDFTCSVSSVFQIQLSFRILTKALRSLHPSFPSPQNVWVLFRQSRSRSEPSLISVCAGSIWINFMSMTDSGILEFVLFQLVRRFCP